MVMMGKVVRIEWAWQIGKVTTVPPQYLFLPPQYFSHHLNIFLHHLNIFLQSQYR